MEESNIRRLFLKASLLAEIYSPYVDEIETIELNGDTLKLGYDSYFFSIISVPISEFEKSVEELNKILQATLDKREQDKELAKSNANKAEYERALKIVEDYEKNQNR